MAGIDCSLPSWAGAASRDPLAPGHESRGSPLTLGLCRAPRQEQPFRAEVSAPPSASSASSGPGCKEVRPGRVGMLWARACRVARRTGVIGSNLLHEGERARGQECLVGREQAGVRAHRREGASIQIDSWQRWKQCRLLSRRGSDGLVSHPTLRLGVFDLQGSPRLAWEHPVPRLSGRGLGGAWLSSATALGWETRRLRGGPWRRAQAEYHL